MKREFSMLDLIFDIIFFTLKMTSLETEDEMTTTATVLLIKIVESRGFAVGEKIPIEKQSEEARMLLISVLKWSLKELRSL